MLQKSGILFLTEEILMIMDKFYMRKTLNEIQEQLWLEKRAAIHFAV